MSALKPESCHLLPHVKKVLQWEVLCFLRQASELSHLLQALANYLCVVRKHHAVNLFLAKLADAMLLQQIPYLAEANLLLKGVRINHGCKVTILN